MINSSRNNPDDSHLPRAYAPEANIQVLTDAAQNSGYFNMLPDSDGSNRWSPLVIGLETIIIPRWPFHWFMPILIFRPCP